MSAFMSSEKDWAGIGSFCVDVVRPRIPHPEHGCLQLVDLEPGLLHGWQGQPQ
jgi:hypothetical protein